MGYLLIAEWPYGVLIDSRGGGMGYLLIAEEAWWGMY